MKRPVDVEHRFGFDHFQARHAAVAADHALRPEAGVHHDALGLGLFNLLERGRHFVALLQADDVDLARSHAQRGERDVHHFVRSDGRDVVFGRDAAVRVARVLPQHLARRGARHVHGDIAAADHHHSLADAEPVSEVRVQQKVDALEHTVQLDAGNREIAAAMRAHRDHHGVESIAAQAGDGEIAPRRLIQLQRDVAQIENLAYLRFHDAARKAVLRNSEAQHAAGDRRGLEDRDRVTHQRQIVRRRKSHRAAADDGHAVGQFLGGALHWRRSDGATPAHTAR